MLEGPTNLLLLAAIAVVVAGVALLLVRERELARARGALHRSAAAMNEGATSLDQEEAFDMADWLGLGLVRIGPAGHVARANDSAHRMVGRSSGSLGGLSTMEAFVDHRIEELVRQAAQGGSAQRELSFGGEPPATLMVRTRRAASGGGVWLILEDISELRRLQRIRTEFIDNLSHELRTPLTTVRLLAEALVMELERTEVPPHVRESILKIDVESGYLAQMVSELLDLARIEQGESPLQAADVDLGRVIETTIERLRMYAERHGVSLRSDLPAEAGQRTVRGDEERLGQVVVNLVDNAVKFSEAGDEVLIRVRPAGEEVVLEVEDKGVGIPSAEQSRIFERFYKVDRARSRSRGGTGLGLAIARHVVDRHGGRISVQSTEGAGSRFMVALPASGAEPTG